MLRADPVPAALVLQGRCHVRPARHACKVQAVCHTGLQPQTSRPQAGLLLTRVGLALDRAVTFYQIATKIESVYLISLPPEVSALLQLFHVAFAIDLDSFGLPLGCLSLASFYNKLICMMLIPVILCLLVVLGCVVGSGLIARLLQWLARMLRVLSRLGSKRMPPVDDEEEEEEASRAFNACNPCHPGCTLARGSKMCPMLQPYIIHPATPPTRTLRRRSLPKRSSSSPNLTTGQR